MNIIEYAKHSNRSKQLISRWVKPGGLLESVHKRSPTGRIIIDVEKADYLIRTQLNTMQSRRKEEVIKKQFPPEQQIKKQNFHSKDDSKINHESDSPKIYTLQDALVKDKYYSAALKKQKLDMQAGTLVLKADVEKEAFDCARQIRDAMLNIPNRVSAILAAEKEESVIDKILTTEIIQALQTFAEA